ncbi:MAG TPA: hypothetical protein PLR88_02350 [Bacteroidales bacterium]|nr:hypothetical protein [Bacteroidales bacterium]
MKNILPLSILSLIICHTGYSQKPAFDYTGKPVTEIFTDFHSNINDTSKTTGFGLNRAYLGYNFLPAGDFSGSIIVNIGSPDDLPSDAVHRRYAYFREASVSYSKDNLKINFGITSTRLFDFQQKFWGKRYVANTYQSINGYGNVADLGVVVDYKFNDIIKGDFSIMNGEGYTEIQTDNSVKTSAGLTVTPTKQFAIRLYGDIDRPDGVWQCTLVGFAGFKNELVTVGVETSYKSNLDLIEGHDSWGISGTGGVNVSEKIELFTRYDRATSFTASGDTKRWNHLKDGDFSIVGIQYSFNQNVKMALNYQGTHPREKSRQDSDAIYINALFRF